MLPRDSSLLILSLKQISSLYHYLITLPFLFNSNIKQKLLTSFPKPCVCVFFFHGNHSNSAECFRATLVFTFPSVCSQTRQTQNKLCSRPRPLACVSVVLLLCSVRTRHTMSSSKKSACNVRCILFITKGCLFWNVRLCGRFTCRNNTCVVLGLQTTTIMTCYYLQ